MREIILDIQGLTRRYGSLAAVDAVPLKVNSNEIFGLLGSNGAGKSTMIKMLTTLLPSSSGDARVAGFSVRKQPVDLRRSIGYVPQAVSVDGSLTGYENMLIFAKLYDLTRHEQKARIGEALEFMGLSAEGNRMVNQYSGGMVRRLEIAQSTLHRPRVLFLDEPTVGLDPIARDAVWKRLVDLRATYGTTLFFASNAIYPTAIMPNWLQTVSHLNPLSYVVDALRTCMLAESTSTFGLSQDYAVILLTTTVLVFIAARLYPRLAT